MLKYKIKKGQEGFQIDWGSGLDPNTQKAVWDILYGSKKNLGITKNYLNSSKTANESDIENTFKNILSSIPLPEAQIASAAMAVNPAVSGLIGSGAELLGGIDTKVNNAQGLDKAYNFLLKYHPGFKVGSQLASAVLGNEGLKTEIKTDDSLTQGQIGYTPETGIDATEVSYLNDSITGPWGALKSNIAGIKEDGVLNHLKNDVTDLKSKGLKNYLGEKISLIENNKLSTKLQEKASKIDYLNLQKQRESKKAVDVMQGAQASYRDILNKNQQILTGGRQFLLAKAGTKLPELARIKKKANTLKSVIPDGKLHSRINSHGDDVTRKGIPVVTYKEGETIQHAEIEKEELILNIEITRELEKLWKEYKDNKDDKLLISAGELLSKEILENTDDNVGLLNTV